MKNTNVLLAKLKKINRRPIFNKIIKNLIIHSLNI